MGLLEHNQAWADSGRPGFVPWWMRCTPVERQEGIRRLKRALLFCRGRAADLAPHLREHIKKLERIGELDGY